MGQITKRGEYQWRAKVRRKGFPEQSRTFTYKEDAEKWVRTVESELETKGFIDRREAEKNTLAAILKRYQQEITPGKKSAAIESVKIDVLLRDTALVGLKMTAITSTEVARWRDRRLKEVTGGTVNREIDVLSTVLNHARREWGIHVENPIPLVKRPEKARARDRRLSHEEESYLLAALTGGVRQQDGTFTKGARNPWLLPLVRLALETAMRRGELLEELPSRPKTERGKPVERVAGSVFPTTAMALRKGFARAIERAQQDYLADCKAARRRPQPGFLSDVHFHDTRHEAASRLAEKLSNVLELSAVTGHRDLRMLKRYYHPRAEDLAKKLG